MDYITKHITMIRKTCIPIRMHVHHLHVQVAIDELNNNNT